MADDWIKMRHNLREDPAVIQMAVTTSCDTDVVIGKLHRLWSWFDAHTRDGFAHGITAAWFDNLVGFQGFCEKLCQTGWMNITPQGVSVSKFENHNGESAKKRADDAKRQRLSRKRHKNVTTPCDKVVTRGEENRGDKRRVRRKKEEDCTETAESPSSEPPSPVALVFPTDGKQTTWSLRESQVASWQALYPSISVIDECRKALAWIEANRSKRKTATGMPAFLVRWLGRSNDNGGGSRWQPTQKESATQVAMDWAKSRTEGRQ